MAGEGLVGLKPVAFCFFLFMLWFSLGVGWFVMVCWFSFLFMFVGCVWKVWVHMYIVLFVVSILRIVDTKTVTLPKTNPVLEKQKWQSFVNMTNIIVKEKVYHWNHCVSCFIYVWNPEAGRTPKTYMFLSLLMCFHRSLSKQFQPENL